VLFALIMRELKTRFGGRLVGLFWVLFEPVMNIFILLFIRTVMRAHTIGPTIEYPVYHVVAMIPFFVFRSCWFARWRRCRATRGCSPTARSSPSTR
jgi:capsular polysaccharide transport system permease protein